MQVGDVVLNVDGNCFYRGRKVEILRITEIADVRVMWVKLADWARGGTVEFAVREANLAAEVSA